MDYDSDTILVEPLISRAKTGLLRTIIKFYNNLTDHGLQPRLHILDNELSALIKYFISKSGTTHQVVLPGSQ